MTASLHTWKALGAALLAYEAAAVASERGRIEREIPFITHKVRPQPASVRLAASLTAGVLVAQGLRPLPRSIRYPVASAVAANLFDHFRPCRTGFWPFCDKVS